MEEKNPHNFAVRLGNDNFKLKEITIRDDFGFEIETKNGKIQKCFLDKARYEILFDMGIIAMYNGFYKEAISDFSSALERFYEFFVYTINLAKGVDYDEFYRFFKSCSDRSEVQYGIFLISYYSEFREIYIEDNNLKNIRNKVIHKGYLPTNEETYNFGRRIHDIINEILKIMIYKYCYDGEVFDLYVSKSINRNDSNVWINNWFSFVDRQPYSWKRHTDSFEYKYKSFIERGFFIGFG